MADMPESLGYATMGDRFLALLCDTSVETILIGALLAIFTLTSSTSSLGFEGLKAIAIWIIPAAYMTVADGLFHGSIGTRHLPLQLRTDSPDSQHPTWPTVL